jgi:hypothetical protein
MKYAALISVPQLGTPPKKQTVGQKAAVQTTAEYKQENEVAQSEEGRNQVQEIYIHREK